VDGKWGRIGADGRWLLEPKFDYLSRGGPIVVASTDGKRGFLRADGSWLIEPRFDAAGIRDRDAATAFVTVDGMTGVIKLKDQSWAVPPRPGVMCDISYGILSKSTGKLAVLSPSGETWLDIEAERIGIDLESACRRF
jgi:hypothetical protein